MNLNVRNKQGYSRRRKCSVYALHVSIFLAYLIRVLASESLPPNSGELARTGTIHVQ